MAKCAWLAVGLVIGGGLLATPASAEDCKFIGGVTFGGVEPTMAVNGTCTDPGFNDKNFVIDSVTNDNSLGDGFPSMPYTKVTAHFTPTKTLDQLPPDQSAGSPETFSHGVIFYFPAKEKWQHRFYQTVYPLPGLTSPNPASLYAAFVSGAYVVQTVPGTAVVGYRVDAAAAKLAKVYAGKLYNDTGRIYGYIFGSSGGSMQSAGAAQGTIGVWDGAIPTVLATDGLNIHSFDWDSLYALAIPAEKRAAIAAAAAPGSHTSIYDGLTAEERASLDEYLRAGFSKPGLELYNFDVTTIYKSVCCDVDVFDPTYEDDFWSKAGFEGTNPPAYLAAAKVDGFATITAIARNDKGEPTSVKLDPATVPTLGSIGANGLRFYVYAADGVTRTRTRTVAWLTGELSADRATLNLANNADATRMNGLAPTNHLTLLKGLTVGGKIRINNRFLLAMMFYPRHSILPGNTAYDQYINADGTPKYVQRVIKAWVPPTTRTTGGLREDGKIKFKTIVMNSMLDQYAYPYTAAQYAREVAKELGPAQTDKMFRVYFQESSEHGGGGAGANVNKTINYNSIRLQALRDLAAWAEKGTAPPPSTHYKEVDTQIILPKDARSRGGLQPVITLMANGSDRAEVAAGQPVTFEGKLETPPGTGKIVSYDWCFGGAPVQFEPATVLETPKPLVNVKLTHTFATPGTYFVSLRTSSQRDGNIKDTTVLLNITRVRVVVK